MVQGVSSISQVLMTTLRTLQDRQHVAPRSSQGDHPFAVIPKRREESRIKTVVFPELACVFTADRVRVAEKVRSVDLRPGIDGHDRGIR
jgi:hypothetical protein